MRPSRSSANWGGFPDALEDLRNPPAPLRTLPGPAPPAAPQLSAAAWRQPSPSSPLLSLPQAPEQDASSRPEALPVPTLPHTPGTLLLPLHGRLRVSAECPHSSEPAELSARLQTRGCRRKRGAWRLHRPYGTELTAAIPDLPWHRAGARPGSTRQGQSRERRSPSTANPRLRAQEAPKGSREGGGEPSRLPAACPQPHPAPSRAQLGSGSPRSWEANPSRQLAAHTRGS